MHPFDFDARQLPPAQLALGKYGKSECQDQGHFWTFFLCFIKGASAWELNVECSLNNVLHLAI